MFPSLSIDHCFLKPQQCGDLICVVVSNTHSKMGPQVNVTRTEYIPVAPQVDGVEILMPIAYAPVARTSEDCDLFNVIVSCLLL